MNLSYHFNLIKLLLVREYPKLRNVLKVNYGLLPEVKDERDYIMGVDSKINWKILNPDSNWLPEAKQMIDEVQKGRYLETFGCTGYALKNIKEMLRINKWGQVINESDRFLNKISGTGRNGNTFSRVLKAEKNYGWVKESEYSWDRTKFNWNEYYKTIPQEIRDRALINSKKELFGYDSVWATKSMIIEALKYSPLYVGLYAWYRKGMFYYSVANPNHASVIINRNQFMCYDSYDPYIKNLDEGFKIYYVKRIYLERADQVFDENKIKTLRTRGFKYLMRTDKFNGGKGEVYILTDDNKVIELTDQDKLEAGVEGLAKRGDLTGISEKDYFNLIK